MKTLKIGFIGLGNMGGPMARNILKAGFDLAVWNRTRSRSEELVREGARAADSPAALTRESDVVLACLADIPASLEVFLGSGGVVAASRPGQVLADHSTLSRPPGAAAPPATGQEPSLSGRRSP